MNVFLLKFNIYLIMNLLRIKKKSDEMNISIRSLSTKIGMSEQNLHKCIRDNRIEAGVLEKIAEVLDVSVSYFFDEVESVSGSKDDEIIELQRKYIALLEAQLKAEEKLDKKVG